MNAPGGNSSRTIVMLPESYPVARLLCEYVFNGNGAWDGAVDLLVLKKQAPGFASIIASHPFRAVHALDEEYYGRVTKAATADFLRKKMLAPYDRAYFPVNTFRANAYLLGAAIAREVKAVNSSLYKKGFSFISGFDLSGADAAALPAIVPWQGFIDVVERAKDTISARLRQEAGSISSTGERPSLGIMEGFAHDLELFCNYALGATHARGKRVLDIGGGLGFGSYLLSQMASEVVYVDKSPEAVQIIKRLWSPLANNLKAVSADVGRLDMTDGGGFDVVYLMEVLEHVRDPVGVLKKVRSLVKDDGLLVVTTPEEDLFPYSVSPPERWDDPTDELLSEAIWPWHIQPLGEKRLLPMLREAGFEVTDKSYITYTRGTELKRALAKALNAKDPEAVIGCLNMATAWDIRDFGVTSERDLNFSAFFYNVTARKA